MITPGKNTYEENYTLKATSFIDRHEGVPNAAAFNSEETKIGIRNMIITMGAMMVGSMVTKKIGYSVGKYVRNLSAAKTTQTSTFFHKKVVAAASHINTPGEPSWSDFGRVFDTYRNLESSFQNKVGKEVLAYNKFRDANKERGALGKFADFWSDRIVDGSTRRDRIIGYASRKIGENFSTMAVGYAVDRIVNAGGDNRPKWYDVGGNVKDFTSYAISSLTVDAALGGGGYIASKALGFGRKVISGIANNKPFHDRLFQYSNYIGNKVLPHVSASIGLISNLNRVPSTFSPLIKNQFGKGIASSYSINYTATNPAQKYYNKAFMKKTWDNIKNIYSDKLIEAKEVNAIQYGRDAIAKRKDNIADQLIKSMGGIKTEIIDFDDGNKASNIILDPIRDKIKKTRYSDPMELALGLERSKAFSKEKIDEVINTAKNVKVTDSHVQQPLSMFDKLMTTAKEFGYAEDEIGVRDMLGAIKNDSAVYTFKNGKEAIIRVHPQNLIYKLNSMVENKKGGWAANLLVNSSKHLKADYFRIGNDSGESTIVLGSSKYHLNLKNTGVIKNMLNTSGDLGNNQRLNTILSGDDIKSGDYIISHNRGYMELLYNNGKEEELERYIIAVNREKKLDLNRSVGRSMLKTISSKFADYTSEKNAASQAQGLANNPTSANTQQKESFFKRIQSLYRQSYLGKAISLFRDTDTVDTITKRTTELSSAINAIPQTADTKAQFANDYISPLKRISRLIHNDFLDISDSSQFRDFADELGISGTISPTDLHSNLELIAQNNTEGGRRAQILLNSAKLEMFTPGVGIGTGSHVEAISNTIYTNEKFRKEAKAIYYLQEISKRRVANPDIVDATMKKHFNDVTIESRLRGGLAFHNIDRLDVNFTTKEAINNDNLYSYLNSSRTKEDLGMVSDYYKAKGVAANRINIAFSSADLGKRSTIYGESIPWVFTEKREGDFIERVTAEAPSIIKAFGNALPLPGRFLKPLGMSGMSEQSRPTSLYFNLSLLTHRAVEISKSMGIGPSQEDEFRPFLENNARFLGKRLAQLALGVAAYKIGDTIIDESGLFDGTSLGGGLTTFGSDIIAKANIAVGALKDATGIAPISQYMEGLMPDSSTIIPGIVAGAIVGSRGSNLFSPVKGALVGFAVAQLARASGNFEPFKGVEETRDEVTGEKLLARKRKRWWAMSMEPFQGDGVDFFIPSTFKRISSQYEYTPSAKGSKLENLIYGDLPILGFNPVGLLLDRYHYERKHYYTRPEVYTGSLFGDIPLTGGAISSVLGGFIKPELMMHQDTLEQSMRFNPLPEGITAQSPNSLAEGISRTFNEDVIQLTGLAGFKLGSMMEYAGFNSNRPIGPNVTFSQAGKEYSAKSEYQEADLGDVMFAGTEFLRRIFTKDQGPMEYNPISSIMSTHGWLPGELGKGNSFKKLKYADIRLPGESYEKIYDVKHKFPTSSSKIGVSYEKMVQEMLGVTDPADEELLETAETGTMIHRLLQSKLAMQGRLKVAEQSIYDVRNDISGFIDAMGYDEKGNEMLYEIKTYGEGGAPTMEPKEKHVHQINFYMAMTNRKQGTLMYVPREDPFADPIEYVVKFNPMMLEQDLRTLAKARAVATHALNKGIGLHTGVSYSQLDRYRIVSDVAPTSEEYDRIDSIVQTQIAFGKLSEEEIKEYNYYKQLRQKRLHRYETYPYRFSRGKDNDFSVETPGIKEVGAINKFTGLIAEGEITKNAMTAPSGKSYINYYNTNDYMLPAVEYNKFERVIGSAYERLTHANTIFNKKFINQYTPVQLYEQEEVYGKRYRPWTDPYGSFIQPQVQSILGSNSTLEGAWHGAAPFVAAASLGLGSFPASATLGAIAGGAINLTSRATRSVFGLGRYAPDAKEDQNKINQYLDQMEYYKNMSIYAQTGNQEALEASRETMIGATNRQEFFKGVPFPEKSYLSDFLSEQDPKERERIERIAPKFLIPEMRNEWRGNSDTIVTPRDRLNMPENWEGWNPEVTTDEVKASIIKYEAKDMRDYGMGYGMDRYRLSDTHLNKLKVGLGPHNAKPESQDTIRSIVRAIVGNRGQIEFCGSDPSSVTITIV